MLTLTIYGTPVHVPLEGIIILTLAFAILIGMALAVLTEGNTPA